MSGWIRGVWGAIKGTKPQVTKTTGTEVVNPFKFKASETKLEKNLRKINVSIHKMKGKMTGDFQKMEREIEPFRRKLKQTLKNND